MKKGELTNTKYLIQKRKVLDVRKKGENELLYN